MKATTSCSRKNEAPHGQVEEQSAESGQLEKAIRENLKGLGYGW